MPRHLNVIERDGVIRKLLIVLVSFARDQHDVARLGQLNRAPNRFGAIGNFFVMVRTKTFFNFRDDRVRIFFARIIGSDDGKIGMSIHNLAHERTLLPVAIPTASEDDD